METAMRTLQVTLPITDVAFLRHQSRGMGWQVATIRPKRTVEPKIKMTEEEFRAKIERSSAQAAEGKVITMHSNETPEQFINRMIAKCW